MRLEICVFDLGSGLEGSQEFQKGRADTGASIQQQGRELGEED